MIVAYEEQSWKIITQRTHGLLAGQICAQWKLTDQPERWVETLIATTEHDDVFNEFERNPLIDDNGAPINFKETRFDLDCSARLMDMALTKSRFIALLIGRHIQFTHGSDALARQFITNLKKQERKWIKEAGVTKNSVGMAYELLEFCDAFSLLICQSQIPPEGRRVEISSGPDGTSYVLYQKEDAILVEPWPFVAEKFSVSFEARTIKQLKFRSDEELRSKLKSSAVDTYQLQISKP